MKLMSLDMQNLSDKGTDMKHTKKMSTGGATDKDATTYDMVISSAARQAMEEQEAQRRLDATRKKLESRAKENAIKAVGAMVKAGTAFKSAKKEVGSRLKSGVPSAINAVGKVGNTAIQKAADSAKRLRNKVVFGKDAKSAASKDTEKKAKGGSVGSASRRADGCAIRGKTRGRVS